MVSRRKRVHVEGGRSVPPGLEAQKFLLVLLYCTFRVMLTECESVPLVPIVAAVMVTELVPVPPPLLPPPPPPQPGMNIIRVASKRRLRSRRDRRETLPGKNRTPGNSMAYSMPFA